MQNKDLYFKPIYAKCIQRSGIFGYEKHAVVYVYKPFGLILVLRSTVPAETARKVDMLSDYNQNGCFVSAIDTKSLGSLAFRWQASKMASME